MTYIKLKLQGSVETGLNHFALKAKLRLKAVQAAWDELDRFRDVYSDLIVKSA